jgi:hypothetical protein
MNTDKYERLHSLAHCNALTQLYAEDILDLLAEVIHSRKLLAHIARDESITIVGYDGTRYTPDGTYGTEESE